MKSLSVLLCLLVMAGSCFAETQLWSTKLKSAAVWNKVTFYGTLLVGSKSNISAIDPESGKTLWTRDDMPKSAPFNVRELPGTPLILVSNHTAGLNRNACVQAVDQLTGETVWAAKTEQGYGLGVYPVPERDMLVLFATMWTKELGNGVHMIAFNTADGEQLWHKMYEKGNKVPFHMADNVGGFSAKFDLSGHPDPIVDGGLMYVPFLGLRAIDLDTGDAVWDVSFKTADKSYKDSYAQPIIDGDTIYASGRSMITAIDKASGTQKWTTKIKPKLVGQMVVAGEMVFVKGGGLYYPSGGKEPVPQKPMGVTAINKATGKLNWEFTKLKDSLTNLLVLEELNTVMVADSGNLIGLDFNSEKKVKESFRLPVKFIRKAGAAENVAKGMKIGSGLMSGGLMGGLQGAVASGNKKGRMDPPIAVVRNDAGDVIVRGQHHILAFDPESKNTEWSVQYAVPGASNLKVLAMGSFAMLNSMANAGMHTSMRTRDNKMNNAFKGVDRFRDVAAARFAKSQEGNEEVYFLSQIGKTPGIIGVDIVTGENTVEVPLNDKAPVYTVDEVSKTLYHFTGKGTKLVAYQL